MVGTHHFTRIDTLELKEHISRKIGPQRAQQYFDHLKRFFAMKLSKPEFDRSCIRAIGRENLPLHNKLIRALLQNPCHAKAPPQKPRKPEKPSLKVGLPQSPRKVRSPINRDHRKPTDRRSPLGPLGKSPSLTYEETFTRTQEQVSPTELRSIGSRPPVLEEGEEVEQSNEGLDFRRLWGMVTAPLGVSVNSGGARKYVHKFDDVRETCENSGGLPDTVSLRRLLQRKFASEGVEISTECTNLLNSGLDAYLKRLIGIARSQAHLTNVSMLDFRVAIESNPRVLGEGWPLQLEKICHYSS